MADIFERMWTMGVPVADMKDLTKVEPFRISTVGERLLMRKAAEDAFNLHESAFVENPWGFPIIPLPAKRNAWTNNPALAPTDISFEGIGHPIFWIDPTLTRRTEEEKANPAAWPVRMFYLIMAFGMFDPDTLRWYDTPRARGIEYTREDWIAYRQGTNSALDSVEPLHEGNLIVPLSEVTRQTRVALDRCAELQTEIWAQYRAELDAAYRTAVASTQGRSEWDALERRIRDTTGQIAAATENGIEATSLIPDVYSQVRELERILKHTERCALILSLPALSDRYLGDSAAVAATAIKAANADTAITTDALNAEVHRLFDLDSRAQPADFVRLHTTATALYMQSWRGLMVSARNLIRAADGLPIYTSWEQFELVEDVRQTNWPPLAQVLADTGR